MVCFKLASMQMSSEDTRYDDEDDYHDDNDDEVEWNDFDNKQVGEFEWNDFDNKMVACNAFICISQEHPEGEFQFRKPF